jgi:4-hydroxy-tetrahydrodipicolinate reductase
MTPCFQAAAPHRLGLDSGTLAGMRPNGIMLTADPLTLLAHAQAVVDFTTPMVSTMLAELAISMS